MQLDPIMDSCRIASILDSSKCVYFQDFGNKLAQTYCPEMWQSRGEKGLRENELREKLSWIRKISLFPGLLPTRINKWKFL